jgi:hypothetical protein
MARAFKFELGQKVRSKVNGFSGIITGRTEWLYGCLAYTVAPMELDKDGDPRKSEGFDEDTLELIETKLTDTNVQTGGPATQPAAVNR